MKLTTPNIIKAAAVTALVGGAIAFSVRALTRRKEPPPSWLPPPRRPPLPVINGVIIQESSVDPDDDDDDDADEVKKVEPVVNDSEVNHSTHVTAQDISQNITETLQSAYPIHVQQEELEKENKEDKKETEQEEKEKEEEESVAHHAPIPPEQEDRAAPTEEKSYVYREENSSARLMTVSPPVNKGSSEPAPPPPPPPEKVITSFKGVNLGKKHIQRANLIMKEILERLVKEEENDEISTHSHHLVKDRSKLMRFAEELSSLETMCVQGAPKLISRASSVQIKPDVSASSPNKRSQKIRRKFKSLVQKILTKSPFKKKKAIVSN